MQTVNWSTEEKARAHTTNTHAYAFNVMRTLRGGGGGGQASLMEAKIAHNGLLKEPLVWWSVTDVTPLICGYIGMQYANECACAHTRSHLHSCYGSINYVFIVVCAQPQLGHMSVLVQLCFHNPHPAYIHTHTHTDKTYIYFSRKPSNWFIHLMLCEVWTQMGPHRSWLNTHIHKHSHTDMERHILEKKRQGRIEKKRWLALTA